MRRVEYVWLWLTEEESWTVTTAEKGTEGCSEAGAGVHRETMQHQEAGPHRGTFRGATAPDTLPPDHGHGEGEMMRLQCRIFHVKSSAPQHDIRKMEKEVAVNRESQKPQGTWLGDWKVQPNNTSGGLGLL